MVVMEKKGYKKTTEKWKVFTQEQQAFKQMEDAKRQAKREQVEKEKAEKEKAEQEKKDRKDRKTKGKNEETRCQVTCQCFEDVQNTCEDFKEFEGEEEGEIGY
ncbi:hypothetical protein L5515_015120 [Caenorhabditis briggsae]|uniref:Uncharacterized protein n=1 Tax=Caenorhabditis briggsae TaxID=6238 RepID=A0AAE9EE43_CAEBR|nr:hypothetical protein L5515_015120 [Caenorhabditis briggsae]